MIQAKKRSADSTSENQLKKPKFEKNSAPKRKFEGQNADKKPFKKSGEFFFSSST